MFQKPNVERDGVPADRNPNATGTSSSSDVFRDLTLAFATRDPQAEVKGEATESEAGTPAEEEEPRDEQPPKPFEKLKQTWSQYREKLKQFWSQHGRHTEIASLIFLLGILAGRVTLKIWPSKKPEKAPDNVLVSKHFGLQPLLLSTGEALEKLSAKKFTQVVELENPHSGLFSYLFIPEEKEDPNDAEPYVLKGIQAGSERADFLEQLSSRGVEIDGGTTSTSHLRELSAKSSWSTLLLTLPLLGVALYAITKVSKAASPSSHGGAVGAALKERSNVNFGDVGALDHIIEELREVKEDIAARMAGKKANHLPKGVLLTGREGVGKTLLARALAGETECVFLYANSSEFTSSPYMGTWVRRVLDTFKEGRKERDKLTAQLRKKPGATGMEEGVCIIFLDEFDSVGSSRISSGPEDGSDKEHKNVVNAVLAEMDSIDEGRNKNIIVVAATNLGAILDAALKRPGRFEKKFEIPLPGTSPQRLDILTKLAKRLITKSDMSFESEDALEKIARITVGKSGDHLRGILAEAKSMVLRDKRKVITDADLVEAFQRQSFGRIQKNTLPEEKREIVAGHEHGHAITGLACGVKPFIVSMKPRGNTGGRVVPDAESAFEPPLTRDELLRKVLVNIGGRAAELVLNGAHKVSDGASQDFQQIRQILQHEVTNGMLGDEYSLDLSTLRPGEVPEAVRETMNKLVGNAMETAKKIIESVGVETMRKLIVDSLEMDEELIGPAAEEFYGTRVDSDKFKKLPTLIDEFIKDPLGVKKTGSSDSE